MSTRLLTTKLAIGVVLVAGLSLVLLGFNTSGIPPVTEPGSLVSEDKRASSVNPNEKLVEQRPTDNFQSDAASVELPDGSIVTIALRKKTKPLIPQEFSKHYNRLKTLAVAGDSDAAYLLHLGLRNCHTLPRNLKQLESAKALLYERRTIRASRPESDGRYVEQLIPVPDNVDLAEVERDVVNYGYQVCSGISDKMLDESNNWLKLSADLNHSDGTIDYAKQIAMNNPEQAREYYEKAWLSGNAVGLDYLSDMYKKGWGPVPENNTDATLATAYLTAYSLIIRDVAKDVHPRVANIESTLYGAVQRTLSDFEYSLHPHQLTEARNMASKILSENPQCCLLLQ